LNNSESLQKMLCIMSRYRIESSHSQAFMRNARRPAFAAIPMRQAPYRAFQWRPFPWLLLLLQDKQSHLFIVCVPENFYLYFKSPVDKRLVLRVYLLLQERHPFIDNLVKPFHSSELAPTGLLYCSWHCRGGSNARLRPTEKLNSAL